MGIPVDCEQAKKINFFFIGFEDYNLLQMEFYVEHDTFIRYLNWEGHESKRAGNWLSRDEIEIIQQRVEDKIFVFMATMTGN